MLFNSFVFIYFFVVVFGIYFCLTRRAQNVFLLGASYLFYGWWDPRFLSLIIASTLIDYVCGLGLGKTESVKSRRLLLLTSVAINLGLLGFFKYHGFFVDGLVELLRGIGVTWNLQSLTYILPVGISFYTFQTMSYTIDVYRRRLEPTSSLLDFSLFVAFFPQLVAGPIERAGRLLPQIQSARAVDWPMVRTGGWLILLGYFKKVVVADNLAPLVNTFSKNVPNSSASELALGFYATVFFIYADFSGYSDIARGLARLLGFELCENFRVPLFAKNPPDFWRRWHISMSDWFRDYVYQPLSTLEARKYFGRGRWAAMAAFLTLVLSGLWHGANWHFICFGAYHGLLLVGYFAIRKKIRRVFSGDGRARAAWGGVLRVLAFHAHALSGFFIVVRSPVQILDFFTGLLKGPWTGMNSQDLSTFLVFVGPLCLLDLLQESRGDVQAIKSLSLPLRTTVYLAMVAMIVLCGATGTNEFIYFQF